ncbi:CGNR zinc finger domain-containing protein [Streptomyces huiliensis]|uniref:CGNR zinc finger domain-containing protein n=1 Tax=Streptomyces huiliensis TaxID=2876027 RepID=UPI001CBF7BAC|nr:CGNR zinc finger domain-containing protein [Streptomyces huiliensis]MBZ4321061.1 CGNR zinc finger domain-containing protein [Streptomyces huiliensis]
MIEDRTEPLTGGPAEAPEPRFVAGHPVLDLVNTAVWRSDGTRAAELVPDAAAWARWAAAAGLTPATAADVPALLRLRDALGATLDAAAAGVEPPPLACETLHDAFVSARAHAALPPALPLRWAPTSLPDELALLAEELLGDTQKLSRVRRCEGRGCGWFFLDRSRNGARRWCSSGDCGNRDRARRHYARKRGGPDQASH